MQKDFTFGNNAAKGSIGGAKTPAVQPGGLGVGVGGEFQNSQLQYSSELAGFGMPTISISGIHLTNHKLSPLQAKQDPHIDHPNEISPAPLSLIKEGKDLQSMNVKISMVFKETLKSDGMFTFISSEEFIKYVNVCVVQCTSEEASKQISSDPVKFLNPVDGSVFQNPDKSSGITLYTYNIMNFLAGKSQILLSMLSQGITDLSPAKQIAKLLPFAQTTDPNGDVVYDIPLEASFFILDKQGGTNINFLSYFAYSYFDFKSFMDDSIEKFGNKLPSLSIPSISFKQYTLSNVSSDIVILDGNLQQDAFVFVDGRGAYYTGPMHIMPDGTYMKGKAHIQSGTYSPDKILTKKTVPNAKIIDNRELQQISKANFNYSRISEFITNNDAVNSLAQNLGTESLFLKPMPVVSDFWCGLDITGKNRFVFSVNMANLLFKNTLFPGLLKTIRDTDEDEYAKLLLNIDIKEFTIIRRRVKREQQISSTQNMVSFSKDEVPMKMITTSDGRGSLLEKTQLTRQFGPIVSKKYRKIFSINEVFLKHSKVGVRTFSGTDIDIASKNAGTYQYQLNIIAQDPVYLYLKGKVTFLEKILEGDNNSPGWSYYTKFASMPHRSDDILNRFNMDFLSHYNSKMVPVVGEYFITDSIADYVSTLMLLNADADSAYEATKSIRMIEYLTNISSPNTGNPAGVQLVYTLIKDLISNINHLLNQMSHYKKLKQAGSTEEMAMTPLAGGYKDRTFKFSHIFKKTIDVTEASADSPVGYDFLSINENSTAANLSGLRIVSLKNIRQRFDMETSKLFSGNGNGDASIEISQEGAVDNSNAIVWNPADTIKSKKYSFLAPSYVYVPGRETYNLIKNGSITWENPADLCDLMLDVIRYNDDPAGGFSTNDITYAEKIDLPLKTQNRRMDLVSYFSNKGCTFEEESIPESSTGTAAPLTLMPITPSFTSPNFSPSANLKPLTKNVFSTGTNNFNIFSNSEVNQQDQLAEQLAYINLYTFGGSGILTSAINPNSLLYSLTVLDDFKFIEKGLEDDEKINSLLYYNLASSAGGKKIKLQIQAYVLAKALAAGLGDGSMLAPESPLVAAPNHVKSLILSAGGDKTIPANSSVASYISNGDDPFSNPLYYAYINFHYRMLNKIEVFRGFVKSQDGDQVVTQPRWDSMRSFDLSDENFGEDSLLLCRQKRYQNNLMGIDQPKLLEMTFFDEYFFVTGKDVEDTLNIKTDFAILESYAKTTNINVGGTKSLISQGLHGNPKSPFSLLINSADDNEGNNDRGATDRTRRLRRNYQASRLNAYETRSGEEHLAVRTENTMSNLTTARRKRSNYDKDIRESPNRGKAKKTEKIARKMTDLEIMSTLDSLGLGKLSQGLSDLRSTLAEQRTNGELNTRSQTLTDEERELIEEMDTSRSFKRFKNAGKSKKESSGGYTPKSGGTSGGGSSSGGGGSTY